MLYMSADALVGGLGILCLCEFFPVAVCCSLLCPSCGVLRLGGQL
jgi:hypothetical protein